MKKRIVSLILVICFIACLFPSSAFASDTDDSAPEETYYTAIGDSICAGFTQADYAYYKGFDMAYNIEHSPEFCYAQLTGRALGSTVYNLGKLGCNTTELLDILTNTSNNYNGVYLGYIGKSDLISLEIGSNDLLMAVVDNILAAAGTTMSHQQAMALVEPLLTGDVDGIVNLIEVITGIKPSEEQIKAIKDALSDEVLNATLAAAFDTYCANFPTVIEKIGDVKKQTSELAILNYYNPFKKLESSISAIIENYTVQMNAFALDYCNTNSLLLVDITDIQTNMDVGIPDPHPSTYGHIQIAERIVSSLTLTVASTAQKGGTITPSGVNVIKEGESLTFTITPDSGYLISDVLVDNVSVGSVSTYTFDNITADHTITASFKIDEGTPPADGVVYYKTYSALGDSITAGYSQEGYNKDYCNPPTCYVAVAGTKLGVQNNNNLGLLGQKSRDLLDVLTNENNNYHDKFVTDLTDSNLITIDIGSNDLTMALLNMVFDYLKIDLSDKTPEARLDFILSFVNEIKTKSLNEVIKKYLGSDITDDQIDKLLEVLKDTSENSELNRRFSNAYDNFTQNWDGIIKAIRDINPNASIVALGLYDIGPNYKSGEAQFEIETLSKVYIKKMNDYISAESEAAKKEQYLYVDTMGVELITAGGFIMVDPHPSAAGHATIAQRLVDALLNKITAIGGDGVTISPKGATTVAYGLTSDYKYLYTFTAAAGNTVKEVFVDGKKIDTSKGSYTFEKVTGDHTISVTGEVVSAPITPPFTAYYTVTASASKGGIISSSSSGSVSAGSDVTLTITPDPGYEIDYITLDGEQLSASSVITIRNIAANHSVYVAFKTTDGSSTEYKNPFKDVKSSDWFYEAAMYAYANGIVKGTSETTFDPSSTINLAMIRTLLYQLENEPDVVYDSSFSFITQGKWYTDAFVWAYKNGITIESGNGASGPEDKVTREEIVTILYLYAKYKGYNVSASAELNGYTDSGNVSIWAKTAMQWAVAEGLVNGTGNSHLDPGSTATRAEITVLIHRFIEKFSK